LRSPGFIIVPMSRSTWAPNRGGATALFDFGNTINTLRAIAPFRRFIRKLTAQDRKC
jgi:hypothetical protein